MQSTQRERTPRALHPTLCTPSASYALHPPASTTHGIHDPRRQAGATVELTTDYTFKGDETKFACTYDKLPTSVKPGSLILIADGSLVLRVKECLKSSVKCTIENDQSIGERKNMNLPNVKVDLPVLQPKDIDDLQNFGVKRGVDFVAASFVQSAADIAFIRQILGPEGKDIKARRAIPRRAAPRRAAPRRAIPYHTTPRRAAPRRARPPP